MNDSVLDILIFLFDNFMDVEDAPPPERAATMISRVIRVQILPRFSS